LTNSRVGFAIGENKAVLAALIGSFDFKPVGGKAQDIKVMYGITARIVGGLNVEVTVVDGWWYYCNITRACKFNNKMVTVDYIDL
jgi:hypothetical protein